MIKEKFFKDVIIAILVIILFFFAIWILKPLVYSIIFALLLSYIFRQPYKWLLRKTKHRNLSAFALILFLILIIVVPVILILSTLISQAITTYLDLQTLDFAKIAIEAFPKLAGGTGISASVLSSLNSVIPKLIAYFISKFSQFIINLPVILLHFFVILFVFFFTLRDGDKGLVYIKSLSPLSKEVENKFFTQFKYITNSVLLGQLVVGILQGIIAGIGYFVFGVPYALILTLITMFAGIIPLIGPWLVWVPVDIYLFMSGRTGAGIGLLIYGLLIVSWLDAIIRPLIVSKRTDISPAITIIGMIGGMLAFGILGLIIGPLILGYILLVLEIYRNKKSGEVMFLRKVEEEVPRLKL